MITIRRMLPGGLCKPIGSEGRHVVFNADICVNRRVK